MALFLSGSVSREGRPVEMQGVIEFGDNVQLYDPDLWSKRGNLNDKTAVGEHFKAESLQAPG